ncbi:MAG: hypothetical protein M3O03_08070 [Pseudomonadota bacterium]|nr:hypothetical protein [Pseudomonadota bacterium]
MINLVINLMHGITATSMACQIMAIDLVIAVIIAEWFGFGITIIECSSGNADAAAVSKVATERIKQPTELTTAS